MVLAKWSQVLINALAVTDQSLTRSRLSVTYVISVMGQGLGLASISEARAIACVSMYSRTFVNFHFRTVMSKTQWSSNVLFVALILP